MIGLVRAGITLIVCVFLFYVFGRNYTYITKSKNNVLSTIGIGFFLYYALFQMFALPCILSKQSLTFLSILWFIVVVVMLGMFIFFRKRQIVKIHMKFDEKEMIVFIMHNKLVILVIVLILIQCYVAALSTYVGWDSAYYIGTINTSLYTDTMYIYDGTTGLPEKSMPFRYALSSFYMNSAVWCKWFQMEAIIMQRYVVCIIGQLVTTLFVYLIGREVFRRMNEILTFVCMYILCNFLFITEYSSAGFLLNRGYEAKAFCANLLILATIYAYLRLRKNTKDKRNWEWFGIIVAASIPISMSAILIVPALVFVLIMVLFFEKRKGYILRRGFICLVPNIIYIIIYLLHVMDVIIIK